MERARAIDEHYPLFRPVSAWVPILVFTAFTSLFALAHAGRLLIITFPAGAFLVGLSLYWKHPVLYCGFCWWLWFLSPFITRVSEYQSHFFDEKRLMLIAPFLPVLLILIDFLKNFPDTLRVRAPSFPFTLSFLGIFYGAIIGLINQEPIDVLKSLLSWLVPVLFGYYFQSNWKRYSLYKQNIERIFILGILIMGFYGAFQFIVAPEWDKFWLSNMIEAGKNSFGRPEPFGIRVFSTMHSPGPFALFMMAGLLLAFHSKSVLKVPSIAAGYLGFLLSLVRSAWGGWLIGLLTLFSAANLKLQIRLLITILIIAICVIPLSTMEPFSEVISQRLETLSDVQNDGSGRIRQELYASLLGKALTSFVGEGISASLGYDSAFLELLLSFGWLGTIFYAGGLILLVANLFQKDRSTRPDSFLSASRAIVLAMFAQLVFGNVLLAPSGILLWGFIGLGNAAIQYHRSPRNLPR